MLADAIGKMLPVIMAIALTPIQIVAVIMILGGPNARASGPAFLVGWLAALSAVTAVAILLVEQLDDSNRTPLVHWLQIALGILLLWVALRLWQKRPRDDAEPAPPKWLSSIGDARPGRACFLGAALCAGNPKIVALVLAGMSSLAYLSLSPSEVIAVAIAFILLGSSPVIALVLAHAVGGDSTEGSIEALKTFMLRNNNVILMVVFALLGTSVIGNGISGLGQALQ